jgi:ABC-type Mn2+/Zn2+ transport system permease subunit
MFSLPFIQKSLLIGILSSIMLSYLGVYITLRRVVFVGISLAQIATCGYIFGFLINFNPNLTSFIFSLIGVFLFSSNIHSEKIPKDAIIALTYVISLCLSMLFMAKSVKAETHLLNVFSGDILTIQPQDVCLTVIIFILFLISQLLFHRQFNFVSFDPETAEVYGHRRFLWDFIFYSVLSLVFITTINTTGVVFSFGFIVIPALFSILAFDKIKKIFLFSCISSVFSCIAGIVLSYMFDLPAGPTIILSLFFLWVIVVLVSKILRNRWK